MKILYHHRTQAEDAQGIHIAEMVKAFRDLGHKVEMVALVRMDAPSGERARGDLWRWILRYAPDWIYEFMGLAYNLYGYHRLCRAIRSRRPDLIYERYSLNTFCGIWASRRFQIPIVLEVNAPLFLEQRALKKLAFQRLARFSERWICSHSNWTVVVSNVMKQLLTQEGVPPEKITVIPNGVDVQVFHPRVSGEEIRRRYCLGRNVVVGFVGWFRPWHGLDLLLEAMKEAHLAEHGVRLLLVGDGPAYPALRRYIERHDLQSAIIFTGPVLQAEVPAHIAAMDIAVQPSATPYACPMKILEYMAMGKCIVAPDQPNIREILQDRVTGFLFQPGHRESLKSTLLEVLLDHTKREIAGKRACESIYERGYLWKANAQKTLTLLFGREACAPVQRFDTDRPFAGTVFPPTRG